MKLLDLGLGNEGQIDDTEIQNNFKIKNFEFFIRIQTYFRFSRGDVADDLADNWLAIIMQFIDGASFSQVLKEAKARTARGEWPHRPYFEPEELQKYVFDLCTALHRDLHALVDDEEKPTPLVHCDIKPANLMISRKGYKLKIADLGIAKQVMTLSGKSPTNAGGISLAYGSPQQYMGMNAKPVDDIYAVGATLFHLLTGRRRPTTPSAWWASSPADAPTDKQPRLTDIRLAGWQRMKTAYPEPKPLAEPWEEAIRKCLSFDRKDRPQTTIEILKMLEMLGRTQPPETQTPATPHAAARNVTYEDIRASRAVGEKFNRFTLGKVLGGGGMGVVVQAEDRRLKETWALKFLKPDIAEEVIKEELLARSLQHRNIVRTENYIEGPDGSGLLAIPMEFVKGISLDGKLKELRTAGRQFFEVDEIADWIKDLCEAMEHARIICEIRSPGRARGSFTATSKPSNLIVCDDGALKVLDFGLARKVERTISRHDGGNEGLSIPFASPQQAKGLNPKVTDDIYSIGATIYTLLTGKPPPHNCHDLNDNPALKQPSVGERRNELCPEEPDPPASRQAGAARMGGNHRSLSEL